MTEFYLGMFVGIVSAFSWLFVFKMSKQQFPNEVKHE